MLPGPDSASRRPRLGALLLGAVLAVAAAPVWADSMSAGEAVEVPAPSSPSPVEVATPAEVEMPTEPEAPPGPALPTAPPYAYPQEAVPPSSLPEGMWRVPAAAVDLLLVRPLMVTGLVGGAALFVATLPVSAATLGTDEAADALVKQARGTFVRPLGAF